MAKVLFVLEPHEIEPVADHVSVQFYDVGRDRKAEPPKWPFPVVDLQPTNQRRPGYTSTVWLWTEHGKETTPLISLWEQQRIQSEAVSSTPTYRYMTVVDTETEVLQYLELAVYKTLGLPVKYSEYDPIDGLVTEFLPEDLVAIEHYMRGMGYGNWRTNASS